MSYAKIRAEAQTTKTPFKYCLGKQGNERLVAISAVIDKGTPKVKNFVQIAHGQPIQVFSTRRLKEIFDAGGRVSGQIKLTTSAEAEMFAKMASPGAIDSCLKLASPEASKTLSKYIQKEAPLSVKEIMPTGSKRKREEDKEEEPRKGQTPHVTKTALLELLDKPLDYQSPILLSLTGKDSEVVVAKLMPVFESMSRDELRKCGDLLSSLQLSFCDAMFSGSFAIATLFFVHAVSKEQVPFAGGCFLDWTTIHFEMALRRSAGNPTELARWMKAFRKRQGEASILDDNLFKTMLMVYARANQLGLTKETFGEETRLLSTVPEKARVVFPKTDGGRPCLISVARHGSYSYFNPYQDETEVSLYYLHRVIQVLWPGSKVDLPKQEVSPPGWFCRLAISLEIPSLLDECRVPISESELPLVAFSGRKKTSFLLHHHEPRDSLLFHSEVDEKLFLQRFAPKLSRWWMWPGLNTTNFPQVVAVANRKKLNTAGMRDLVGYTGPEKIVTSEGWEITVHRDFPILSALLCGSTENFPLFSSLGVQRFAMIEMDPSVTVFELGEEFFDAPNRASLMDMAINRGFRPLASQAGLVREARELKKTEVTDYLKIDVLVSIVSAFENPGEIQVTDKISLERFLTLHDPASLAKYCVPTRELLEIIGERLTNAEMARFLNGVFRDMATVIKSQWIDLSALTFSMWTKIAEKTPLSVDLSEIRFFTDHLLDLFRSPVGKYIALNPDWSSPLGVYATLNPLNPFDPTLADIPKSHWIAVFLGVAHMNASAALHHKIRFPYPVGHVRFKMFPAYSARDPEIESQVFETRPIAEADASFKYEAALYKFELPSKPNPEFENDIDVALGFENVSRVKLSGLSVNGLKYVKWRHDVAGRPTRYLLDRLVEEKAPQEKISVFETKEILESKAGRWDGSFYSTIQKEILLSENPLRYLMKLEMRDRLFAAAFLLRERPSLIPKLFIAVHGNPILIRDTKSIAEIDRAKGKVIGDLEVATKAEAETLVRIAWSKEQINGWLLNSKTEEARLVFAKNCSDSDLKERFQRLMFNPSPSWRVATSSLPFVRDETLAKLCREEPLTAEEAHIVNQILPITDFDSSL
jgi:hypothetical protein